MELLDVELGALAHSAPHDGASALVHFHHVLFGLLAGKSEDALEDHGDIGHQIHGIVVHHHLPGQINLIGRFRFLLDNRIINRPTAHHLALCDEFPHRRHLHTCRGCLIIARTVT